MSDHTIKEVPVVLEPHPNADRLSIVRVGGYTVVVNTRDWLNQETALYVPPDSLVPVGRNEFAFLDAPGVQHYDKDSRSNPDGNYVRVRAVRLRGVVSMGVLIPVPEVGSGPDWAELLGIHHYEPPLPRSTESIPGPTFPSLAPYDIENLRNPNVEDLFIAAAKERDTPLYIAVTEKIHGANARFHFDGSDFWFGSRKEWKAPGSLWQRGAENTPGLLDVVKRLGPGYVTFGEVYGPGVQNMSYGLSKPQVAVFDIWDVSACAFLNLGRVYQKFNTLTVPLLDAGEIWRFTAPADPLLGVGEMWNGLVGRLAEADSQLYNGHSEGVVVRPTQEMRAATGERLIAKVISSRYLMAK